jgi:hypothetical protein
MGNTAVRPAESHLQTMLLARAELNALKFQELRNQNPNQALIAAYDADIQRIDTQAQQERQNQLAVAMFRETSERDRLVAQAAAAAAVERARVAADADLERARVAADADLERARVAADADLEHERLVVERERVAAAAAKERDRVALELARLAREPIVLSPEETDFREHQNPRQDWGMSHALLFSL